MRSSGTGGRGGISQNDERVLDGILSTDERPAGARMRRCANKKCGRFFLSRQDGDDYCSGHCDTGTARDEDM